MTLKELTVKGALRFAGVPDPIGDEIEAPRNQQ